jgi:hypothetical protein
VAANDDKSLIAFVRRRGALLLLLVGGAALLVYLARDDSSQPVLPDYAIVSIVSSREAPAKLELAAGDEAFELVLRPAARVEAKVALYVFAIGEGEPNPVDAKIDVTPEGPIRITGRVRALAGAREVRVGIGAATDFKRYEDALARAREGKTEGAIRVLSVPIVRARP